MKRKILITSALPYVNNIPHLGNIIGCVLPADVYSRYCKLREYKSLFICGSDDYGTQTELKALEENNTCAELCEKYREIHKKIYQWFQIDFDYFGQTSTNDPKNDTNWNHTKISQNIFIKLAENGYFEEQVIEQLFCPELNMFLADRFIIGTCPNCHYEQAKGDQCDYCGNLLDALDLLEPKYKLNEKYKIEKQKTNHLFLNLPKLESQLKNWFESIKDNWSINSIEITEQWFKKGLKSRCITRDFKWGTPIPNTKIYGDKYKEKTMYNWFDAPIGYISITSNHLSDWEEWWKDPSTELVQMMGIDNVVFHSIVFPSCLIGNKDNYILASKIESTCYLTYEGKKFSKSEGIGIFGDKAMDSGIESDYWRFYLLFQRPEIKNSDFVWEDFQSKINGELVNNLGNLIQRVFCLIFKNNDSIIPDYDLEYEDEIDKEFINQTQILCSKYIEKMEKIQLKYAFQHIFTISHFTNKYIVTREPWILAKTNKKKFNNCANLLAHVIGLISNLLKPFIPTSCKKIFNIQNFDYKFFELQLNQMNNVKINKPEIIFEKIDDEKLKIFKINFETNL
ncbi:Methionyl-tRNA synthetase [uncultured virus]|nr:Methionyl-tRNA synthetase [uncultured virus]